MIKYLIFRTDRIGDFIFSRIITKSIKNKYPNAKIDFVCSSYNSKYARNFKDINDIYILDKYDLKLMIKNLIKINSVKYDYLIILDSKRRSFFFSILINAKYKIALLKDWRPYFLLRLFFNKFIINSEINSQYKNFVTLANYIDLKIKKEINYYKNYVGSKDKLTIQKNYLLLHLDEKWFDGFYHHDYQSINLNYKNFDLLIKTLFKKFKKKIIITGGRSNIDAFNKIIIKHFKKIDACKYISIKYKNNLLLFNNISFENLENFVKKSYIVFCCEGAISHVSHAHSKKTFALIDNNTVGKFWTDHMTKITLLKRDKIKKICNSIIKFK